MPVLNTDAICPPGVDVSFALRDKLGPWRRSRDGKSPCGLVLLTVLRFAVERKYVRNWAAGLLVGLSDVTGRSRPAFRPRQSSTVQSWWK